MSDFAGYNAMGDFGIVQAQTVESNNFGAAGGGEIGRAHV